MNNMQSTEQISLILGAVLLVMLVILVILTITYFILRAKASDKKKKKIASTTSTKQTIEGDDKALKKSAKLYNKQPIEKFMEFDKVEDNMIIQKDGVRFLMVIECQGINYDLMSEMEKMAVENGFVEFLNTLRHPIQIYVQTRTVNLEGSILTYKKRVSEVEEKLARMKFQYQEMLNSGNYKQDELNRVFYEITKQTNLCEYGKDVVRNTETMSLNRSVLSKQYYIIIPYYATENGTGNMDKEELKNTAFSELYTKAQSVIRTLSACSVNGRILNSDELVELLYIAYNRDESEVFGLDKAMAAGYDEIYSTAPDVLDKKMRELDVIIERQAVELANQKINEVKSEKEKRVQSKEDKIQDLINDMAKLILQENKEYVGKDVVEESIKKINEDIEKGEDSNVGQEKKTRRKKSTKAI